ncbi:MAG: inosine/xanthosine triphosphatase [Paraglaciecola polaris]|uniref:inosine/xanthosine triphosphatase n=1 Tax=Paraglaciecola polaris TaxID=222814 RepID=UPI00300262FB
MPPSPASLNVIVGSKNPVKVNAARNAIAMLYPEHTIFCQGMHAPSGVAEQPMTSEETRIGAINRVEYCQKNAQADFYVAMEGGVDKFDYGPATFAYIVIANRERQSIGRGAIMPIPESVYQALAAGEELGPLMDKLFNTHNVKQKGGAIGLLTNGNATREGNYTHAMVLAMAPFLHPDLYPIN